MDWLTGIQNAINYIEENLTEKIDYDEAAKQASCSSFYFQRIFSILCGITLGDYIRNRRLTLAGNELSATDNKVIDIALKYGYESPESFTRAFSKFHGVTPSDAKKDGSKLKSFSPLSVKITLSGGNILDYKIIEKAAFDIIEKVEAHTVDNSENAKSIPDFWTRSHNDGTIKNCLILQMTEPTYSVYVTEIYRKMQKHLIILLRRNAMRTQQYQKGLERTLFLQELGQYLSVKALCRMLFRISGTRLFRNFFLHRDMSRPMKWI